MENITSDDLNILWVFWVCTLLATGIISYWCGYKDGQK